MKLLRAVLLSMLIGLFVVFGGMALCSVAGVPLSIEVRQGLVLAAGVIALTAFTFELSRSMYD